MTRRKGNYLGGSSIVKSHPVGFSEKTEYKVPPRLKAQLASQESHELERKEDRIKAEREALRRYEITDNDLAAVGRISSGWGEYSKRLLREFEILAQCRMTRSDQVATVWNKKGFKTGSGQRWSPRLVKIAKDLLKH